MKGLREKLLRHEGFTLIEMLLVVAIVAILIAISIPMVTEVLENSRHAVDDANYRAAAGLADVKYLSDADNAPGTYYYVVNSKNAQGDLVAADEAKEIGKCECTSGSDSGSTSGKKFLKVVITDKGEVTLEWVASAT